MVDCSRQQSMSAAPPFVGWLLRCCPPSDSSRRYVARQREQSLDRRSHRVASSDPLLLSALSSFCCAGWLLPVALPLLLASLPSLRLRQPPRRTGVVTVIALASLLTAATATAAIHCHRQTKKKDNTPMVNTEKIPKSLYRNTEGVCCFYSIVKSIDLIGTCLKLLPYSTYVESETGTLLRVTTSPCSIRVHYFCARWRWRPLACNGAIATVAPSPSADTSSRGPR
jgi:hypothetical protein